MQLIEIKNAQRISLMLNRYRYQQRLNPHDRKLHYFYGRTPLLQE